MKSFPSYKNRVSGVYQFTVVSRGAKINISRMSQLQKSEDNLSISEPLVPATAELGSVFIGLPAGATARERQRQ